VLVVGDLFESAAPTAEAEQVVWEALLRLRATGAHVLAVAGNHDDAASLQALAPVLAAAGITVVGKVSRPDEGGVVDAVSRAGEPARIAMLPWVSQRYAMKAADLFALDAGKAANHYAQRVQLLIEALSAGFRDDAVNLIAAHCFAVGGVLGGGERDAQTIFAYHVDPSAFPTDAHYVALGHLHRTQRIAAGAPVWYCGSPIAVDFSEEADAKHVLIIEATPGPTPASVREVPLTTGARLQTLRGTVEELRDLAASTGDAWLRVFVREPARAGLADEVRALLPRALEVRIERPTDIGPEGKPRRPQRSGRTPHELFASFLAAREVSDERVTALFDRLLDEETSPESSVV
jgi:exonuclease SbcD